MGIELPQDIKDMAIPVQFDARGSSASVGSAFDSADIIRQQQIAENTRITEFNHDQMSKQGLGALIKSGAVETMLAARDAILAREEKSKRDAVDTAIMAALQNRLDGLYDARDSAVNDLNDIRESRAAVDTLRELFENDKLDPNNKVHQELMKKAGITREDLMTDPTGAFDRQAKFWDEREQNKVKEIAEIDQDIKETKQIIDASPEERQELLRMADEDAVHAVASTNTIDAEDLNAELQDRGYSDFDIEMRETAAVGNVLGGGFGFASDEKPATVKSFASTIDLSEPPAMLNLSGDFQIASNAVAPSDNLPVLDLGQEFKLQ